MKRDLNFIRTILTTCADSMEPVDAATFVDAEHPLSLVVYHFQLLKDAGLARVTITPAWDGMKRATVDALTWDGQDFLDAVRSETVWNETRKRIATGAGSVAFTVVKDVASSVAKTMIGL